MAQRRGPPERKAGVPEALTVAEVVELAVRHNLAELEVEADGRRIRVVREHAPLVAPAGSRLEGAALTAARAQAAPAGETAVPANLVTVEAPMVGTFYRAASPGAPPFVSEGDTVKDGQVLCIIEAMKLMNEIEAKVPGRVVRILAENAQPVEFGQPLFQLEPLR